MAGIHKPTQDEIQHKVDIAMGFTGAGTTSKVVANAFAKFGKVAPSASQADIVAQELAKASGANNPLAKLLAGTKAELQGAATAAQKAEATANSISRSNVPGGNPIASASALDKARLIAAAPSVQKGIGTVATVGAIETVANTGKIPVTPEQIKQHAVATLHKAEPLVDPIVAKKDILPLAKQEVAATADPTYRAAFERQVKLLESDPGATKAKGKPIKASDYEAVVKDPRPGQTIYKLTPEQAKARGYKGDSPVYTNIPNDTVQNGGIGASVLSVHDAAAIDTNPSMSPSQKVQIKVDQGLQQKQAIYQEYLAAGTKDSALLPRLQSELQNAIAHQDVSAAAAKDVRIIQREISTEQARIMNVANFNAAKDPRTGTIDRQYIADQDALKEAKKKEPVNLIIDNLSQAAGVPAPMAHVMLANNVSAQETTSWLGNYMRHNRPPAMADARAPHSVTTDLTQMAHIKQAIAEGNDPQVVSAEGGVFTAARVKAMSAVLEAGRTTKSKDAVVAPDFTKLYMDTAKAGVALVLFNQAVGLPLKGAVDHEAFVKSLEATGKTPEEVKQELMSRAHSIALDHMAKQAGLTPDQMANLSKQFLFGPTGIYPPSGLFGISQDPTESILPGVFQ